MERNFIAHWATLTYGDVKSGQDGAGRAEENAYPDRESWRQWFAFEVLKSGSHADRKKYGASEVGADFEQGQQAFHLVELCRSLYSSPSSRTRKEIAESSDHSGSAHAPNILKHCSSYL